MMNSGEESVVVAENLSTENSAPQNNDSGKKKGGFSKIGFVLAAAGAAVGIGNIWRFPIQVQKYGGGAFVLMYLFFCIVARHCPFNARNSYWKKDRRRGTWSF